MEPVVKPLSHSRRRWFFVALFLFFLCSLPAFIFYAAGYRYDLSSGGPLLTPTGGFYVSTDAPEAAIFLNESEVRTARLFRSAAYIQGVEPGSHRLHVQAPGTATWVKELTVHPHLVTEVEAFNLPLVPQVRPITRYVSATGTPVVITTTLSDPFAHASLTVPIHLATATTTGDRPNMEHAFVSDLFAEKASTSALIDRLRRTVGGPAFGFATTATATSALSTEAAASTTTVTYGNIQLYEAGGELYARPLGRGRTVPAYFCVPQAASRTDVEPSAKPLTDPAPDEEVASRTHQQNGLERMCRSEIRIDRQRQVIRDFAFMPGNANLLLLKLEDGIYVTEIDDRSWQNNQLLYPGDDIDFVVNGSRIYVRDGDRYFEILTRVAAP